MNIPTIRFAIRASTLVLLLALTPSVSAASVGSAFTYQGQLSFSGSPVSGLYDLRFTLYDAPAGGNAVGATVTSPAVGVTNGLFAVTLDYGQVFDGSALWLEIAVRTNTSHSLYVTLAPRQPLTAAPYALMANNASNVLGTLPAAQLTGTLPAGLLAGVYPSTVTLGNSGNSFTGSFSGNAAGLSNLNAAALTGSAPSFTVTNLNLNGPTYFGGSTLLIANGMWLGNFFAGPGAGSLTLSGNYNTAVGSLALDADASGGNNSALGYGALGGNTAGNENTASGVNALTSNTNGGQNAAFGAAAMFRNANGAGNSGFGYETLFSNTAGSNNTASGYKSLYLNAGSYNIGLGYQAGYNIGGGSNNIDIGNPGVATDTNVIRLGSGQTQTFIAGVLTANGGGVSNLNASQLLGGVVPLAQLPTALVTNGATGVNLSGTFSGSGMGLTNMSLAAMDDGGSALYQNLLVSAAGFSAYAPLPFSALCPVSSGAPALAFTLDGGEFGNVVSFTGHEALSEPYEFVVQVLADPNSLDPSGQMGRQGRLTFTRGGRTTAFAGLVTGCAAASYDGTAALYTFRLESPLAWMALTTDYRIYPKLATPDIVSSLYQSLTPYNVDSQLQGTYRFRTNTVQYGETSLNFFSRLLEEDGIFYFFSLDGGPPTLILGNTSSAFLPGNVPGFVYYGDTASHIPQGAEFIRTFQKATHESTAATIIQAYSFVTPANNITGSSPSVYGGRGTNFSFGAPIVSHTDIAAYAHIGQEREEVGRFAIYGTANAPDLRPGYSFALTDSTGSGLDNSYVVTAVSHAAFRRVTNGVTSFYYGNQFQVIPSSIPYRPALKTPKPLAQPCIATVTGRTGNEIATDAFGEVYVQFKWDRYGTNDDHSSALIRVATPWAGSQRGMFFLPRIGDEVLVSFVQGDPDQPYVAGSFFNAENMLPLPLPANQDISIIRTESTPGGNGYNEIRFDDTKGQEQLSFTAERDLMVSAGRNTTVSSDSIMQLSGGTLTLSATGHVAVAGVSLDIASPVSAVSFNGDGSGVTNLNASKLATGSIPPARLPAAVITNNESGVVLGGAFAGDGSSLTSLNASQLASGTVPLARLPSAVVTNNEPGANLAGLTVNGPLFATNTIYADSTANNSGTLNPGIVFGGGGSAEGISSKRTSGTDQYGLDFYTAGALRMTIHNFGNVGIGINNPTNKLHVIGGATFASGAAGANQAVVWTPGNASWSFSSDRNLKANLSPVDGELVLEKVSRLPLAEWSYRGCEQRHLGPMAQDFHALFPFNDNDRMIDEADLNGVALAAIQGLNAKLQDKDNQIRRLVQRVEKLEVLLGEARSPSDAASTTGANMPLD